MKIPLQGRVEQADARLGTRGGQRQGRWHRPYRLVRLPAHAGKDLTPVMGTQRPGRTALRRGAAEQLVVTAGEEAPNRLAQHPATNAAQQVQRALVDRTDPAIAVKGQQPLAEQPDRLGLQMKAQQPVMLEVPQEIATLDHLRREVDQRHGVELALARDIRARRGYI